MMRPILTSNGEGGGQLGGGHEAVGGGVAVVAGGKVAVEGGHDGVGLALRLCACCVRVVGN